MTQPTIRTSATSDPDVGDTELRVLQAKLLVRPFYSSFVGRARSDADLADPVFGRRASAWARWAVTSAAEMTGVSDRSYTALVLEGQFHNPKTWASPTEIRPHLEIPARVLRTADAEFPDRLALMGNGLRFPWWLYSEVKALRRCLFTDTACSVVDLVGLLTRHRAVLVDAVSELSRVAAPHWPKVEQLLLDMEGSDLHESATGNVSVEELAEFFPAAEQMRLRAVYDARLRDESGLHAARRVGVWRLYAGSDDEAGCVTGVVTPRLTANSQFSDPLFRPDTESPAALLLRGLLLRRLIDRHLGAVSSPMVVPSPPLNSPAAGLRGVPARVGAKIPEASLEAAVKFMQAHPDPVGAWAAVCAWADRTGGLLTVTEQAYLQAHQAASRFVRRAENPDRDDVNVVLPLAWLDSNVVRLTFAQPPTVR